MHALIRLLIERRKRSVCGRCYKSLETLFPDNQRLVFGYRSKDLDLYENKDLEENVMKKSKIILALIVLAILASNTACSSIDKEELIESSVVTSETMSSTSILRKQLR